jgi:MFS family permease
MRDRRALYAAVFLRALATGMIGVLLGVYLAKLKLGAAASGLVITAGLAGAAGAALVATLADDRWSRRKFLIGLSLVSAGGGVLFAVTRDPVLMAGAAFLGMVNGMGRDRGAALILEQAMLPATVSDDARTRTFAVYNIFQDVGHALGGLLAGLPVGFERVGIAKEGAAFQLSIGVYAVLVLAPAVAYLFLSAGLSVASPGPKLVVSPESRRILWKICPLFALDSLGGGFLTNALLAYFFYERFGVEEGGLGVLFFFARAANAVSHAGAAWLAKRIGLVNTMVFTHIPSSLLLLTVPFAPNFWVAAALFLLRESFVEMDVPTRQSYVMAVVRPEERTFASGVTHLVRMGAWAVAPSFAGLFMKGMLQAAPLFIAAGLKIAYDVLLYAAFRKVKPPEEAGGPASGDPPATTTDEQEPPCKGRS